MMRRKHRVVVEIVMNVPTSERRAVRAVRHMLMHYENKRVAYDGVVNYVGVKAFDRVSTALGRMQVAANAK